MDQLAFSRAEDGWRVRGIPGFEAFELCELRARVVDGEPTLTSVSIRPRPGEHRAEDLALTPERLAGLPGRLIAATLLALHRETEDTAEAVPLWVESMRRLTDVPMVRPRGGSVAFSEEVADVVRVARERGERSIGAVGARWHVSDDRANQYIREMKRLLGDRAPGDGRRERPRRGAAPRQAPVAPPRRAPATLPAPEAGPSPTSRRVRHTTPEEES